MSQKSPDMPYGVSYNENNILKETRTKKFSGSLSQQRPFAMHNPF